LPGILSEKDLNALAEKLVKNRIINKEKEEII